MRSLHVIIVLVLLLVFLLGMNVFLDALFQTPDPVAFAASLGVPVA